MYFTCRRGIEALPVSVCILVVWAMAALLLLPLFRSVPGVMTTAGRVGQ